MTDPEVDWGVDDDFDPWAHPDPDAAQPTSGQGRDNPPSEVHVAVGTATHSGECCAGVLRGIREWVW
jgi:hypothetical protein